MDDHIDKTLLDILWIFIITLLFKELNNEIKNIWTNCNEVILFQNSLNVTFWTMSQQFCKNKHDFNHWEFVNRSKSIQLWKLSNHVPFKFFIMRFIFFSGNFLLFNFKIEIVRSVKYHLWKIEIVQKLYDCCSNQFFFNKFSFCSKKRIIDDLLWTLVC